MTPRVLALVLACAAGAAAPAAAQLRATPSLGGGAGSVRSVPPSDAPVAADYIVAVVNSEPITNTEVRLRMARFEQQLAQEGAALPPRPELRRIVLERLVSEKAQLQLARDLGIRIEDGAIDQAEQAVARQNGLEVAQLRSRMVASGVAPSQFREDLRSQLLLQRLRERELQQRVRVTEADIDQFLREQQADTRPAELTLAQVLVAVPENATPEQLQQLQAKAAEVLRRARAGEDFAQLARQLSDAPEARAGGVLGQRTADRWPELFVDAVRGLPAGGIANVVRSGAGFHVLKLVERRDAGAAVVTQSRARHILLRPGPRLTEQQARERLADYRRRVVTGQAEFAALAREFSQDGSASAGGDLGWAAPGQFVPEFEEVLNQMRPGDISAPVVSRFGVHLIQLLERRQATLSVREQREVARNVLREKKLDEAYAQWAQEVRGRAWVEFREPPS